MSEWATLLVRPSQSTNPAAQPQPSHVLLPTPTPGPNGGALQRPASIARTAGGSVSCLSYRHW